MLKTMKNYDISLLGEYLDEKQKQESDYDAKIYEDINNQLFSDFNTNLSINSTYYLVSKETN